MGSVAQGLSDFGGAVTDLFGSSGTAAAASSYEQASSIAAQNAKLAQQATNIQEAQTSRQIFQTIGSQKASVGGAGFAESGSALDLLRSSAQQGALTKAMISEQGVITASSYSEQAGLYAGLAGSAKASSTGQLIGGLLDLGAGAYNLYTGLTSGVATGTSAASAGEAAFAASNTGTGAVGAAGTAGAALPALGVAAAVGAGYAETKAPQSVQTATSILEPFYNPVSDFNSIIKGIFG